MGEALADAVEIIPNRLYWVTLHTMPRQSSSWHYFQVDNQFTYEPFFADFGPLNLGCTFRYCKLLEGKLNDSSMANKRIVHCCSHDPKHRSNAAYLMGAYQVIVLRKSAVEAHLPFVGIYPPFLPFRDALPNISTFHLTVEDCLKGLEKAMELSWFQYNQFDVETYEFFEKIENGDMNWVMPDKFLAFAGPHPQSTDADGFPVFTPEDYVPIFRNAGIGLVVRLNKKQYDRKRFVDHGIRHADLYFPDGSCPPADIIEKFLQISENERGGIAVHCKAGLGRTGSLIGLYVMKHFKFPARAFIGWNRICRPGSILGPQQQFMCEMEREMFQVGMSSKIPRPKGEDMHQRFTTMNLGTKELAKEDKGQGERLTAAKRGHGPDSPVPVQRNGLKSILHSLRR